MLLVAKEHPSPTRRSNRKRPAPPGYSQPAGSATSELNISRPKPRMLAVSTLYALGARRLLRPQQTSVPSPAQSMGDQMSRLKLLVAAFIALCALSAVVASSAAAEKCPEKGSEKCLPLVHVLETEKFPVLLEGVVTKASEAFFLQTASGAKLSSSQYKLLVDITKLSGLGTFDAHIPGLLEVGAEEEKPCTTTGDTMGTVLIKGEFHLVYGSTTTLNLLLLFLVPSLSLVCKNKSVETTVKVEGSLVAEVKPEASGLDVTTISVKLRCSKTAGKPEITEYLNVNEEAISASLKSNLGGKLQNACENITDNPFTSQVKSEAGEATMIRPLW